MNKYDVTFTTQAMFIVQVEATDPDEAEDLVVDFSPVVDWGSARCIDFGFDSIDIGG